MDSSSDKQIKKRVEKVDIESLVKETSVEEVIHNHLMPKAAAQAYELLDDPDSKIRADQVKDLFDRTLGKRGEGDSKTLVFNFDPAYIEKAGEMARKVLSGFKTVDQEGVDKD